MFSLISLTVLALRLADSQLEAAAAAVSSAGAALQAAPRQLINPSINQSEPIQQSIPQINLLFSFSAKQGGGATALGGGE
jgi:hypothetical protein